MYLTVRGGRRGEGEGRGEGGEERGVGEERRGEGREGRRGEERGEEIMALCFFTLTKMFTGQTLWQLSATLSM